MANQTWLVAQVMVWANAAYLEVLKAGGTPETILPMFPPELVELLARNNLRLIYVSPGERADG